MFLPGRNYKIHNGEVKLNDNGINFLISPLDNSSLEDVQDHIKFIMKECPSYFN
jgi:hypothetical protein